MFSERVFAWFGAPGEVGLEAPWLRWTGASGTSGGNIGGIMARCF